jgi:hypothetical protein
MKYIPILLFLSCTKSSPYVERWIVQEGHDTASYSHAVFCSKEDYGRIDTITITYSDQPELVYLSPGTTYFHKRLPLTDTLFDRYYCDLITKLP